MQLHFERQHRSFVSIYTNLDSYGSGIGYAVLTLAVAAVPSVVGVIIVDLQDLLIVHKKVRRRLPVAVVKVIKMGFGIGSLVFVCSVVNNNMLRPLTSFSPVICNLFLILLSSLLSSFNLAAHFSAALAAAGPKRPSFPKSKTLRLQCNR